MAFGVCGLCDQRSYLKDCRLCRFDLAITIVVLLVAPVRKCNRRVFFLFERMMFINCVCIGCKLTSVCQTRRRGAKTLRFDCLPPDSASSVILESVRSLFAAGLIL